MSVVRRALAVVVSSRAGRGAIGLAGATPCAPTAAQRRYSSWQSSGGNSPPGGDQKPQSKADAFNLIPDSNRLVQVHACLPRGFLVGKTQVEGSIIAVGDLWLRWKPDTYTDVTVESLAALLDIVDPVPELLVLGCGASIRQVDPGLMRGLMDRFVAVEALDTKNAVSTFNILNAEGRAVVGAFLPIDRS